MSEVYIDPAGAFVSVDDQKFYRDGLLYGYQLDQIDPLEAKPIPTLWSSIVARYRKKVVEVDAIQLTNENASEVAEWCGGAVVTEIDPMDDGKRFVGVNIPTLEGVMRASEGDYVIKGIKGEFYPCKPDIFSGSYEIV